MPLSPRHLTLTAETIAVVELDRNFDRIEVLNRDGSAEVFFTTDGSEPGIGQDGCHILAAAIGAVEVADQTSGTNSVVKLISAAAVAVSVRGF
ncbi:hypothetical protein ACIBCR_15085 [Micromonospora echinospora]|uniref:hypothetical protein n=1 Tax=Micromonospora echinospora TaxID=1877 RepID=UPI0037A0974F